MYFLSDTFICTLLYAVEREGRDGVVEKHAVICTPGGSRGVSSDRNY